MAENVSLNFDNDVVDWSDEGEDDDDTPRNHDILSRLAEESEDDCDQDVLQFSRCFYSFTLVDQQLMGYNAFLCDSDDDKTT